MTTASKDPLPPQDMEAERAVLGSIIQEPTAIDDVRGVITCPAEFHARESHAQLYEVLLHLRDRGEPIDAVPIKAEAERRGVWAKWGAFDFLGGLVGAVPSALRAKQYAQRVHELYIGRRVFMLAHNLMGSFNGQGVKALAERIAEAQASLADFGAALDLDGMGAVGGLHVVGLTGMIPREVEWLWPSRIPAGKLTIIGGDPKTGKSLLAVDIAARVSHGTAWPDQRDQRREPRRAILLTAEDDAADTVLPRLIAAGADVERVELVQGVREPQTAEHRLFSLDQDLHRLRQLLDKRPDTGLVVFDPLTAFLGDCDSHINAEVRALLAPLAALAAETHVAVVAITHFHKSGGTKAVYRFLGSLGFAAAARALWSVQRDQADPERRLLLNAGMNLARDPGGLAYRIISDPTGRPVVAWEDGAVSMSADDGLEAEAQDAGDRSATSKAVEWLRAELADGPVASKELQAKAAAEGIFERTLTRARGAIGVKATATRVNGRPTEWFMSLPGQRGPE
jgi:replicative DNA helicase